MTTRSDGTTARWSWPGGDDRPGLHGALADGMASAGGALGRAAPVIEAQIELPLARFPLRVDLKLGRGVTALMGPSGSGKTCLESLAGSDAGPGTITLDGERWLEFGRPGRPARRTGPSRRATCRAGLRPVPDLIRPAHMSASASATKPRGEARSTPSRSAGSSVAIRRRSLREASASAVAPAPGAGHPAAPAASWTSRWPRSTWPAAAHPAVPRPHPRPLAGSPACTSPTRGRGAGVAERLAPACRRGPCTLRSAPELPGRGGLLSGGEEGLENLFDGRVAGLRPGSRRHRASRSRARSHGQRLPGAPRDRVAGQGVNALGPRGGRPRGSVEPVRGLSARNVFPARIIMRWSGRGRRHAPLLWTSGSRADLVRAGDRPPWRRWGWPRAPRVARGEEPHSVRIV
jgi:hypothetical protein